jgi:hypothetical protein
MTKAITSISMSKTYRTVGGQAVELLAVNANVIGSYNVIGICNSAVTTWDREGHYIGSHSPMSLVEVNPYEDFKIDDPVMVRDYNEGHWFCRYFAGINKEGNPTTWWNGTTSWTAKEECSDIVSWSYCRKPTADELSE